jgi:hypothetical protein
LITPIGFGDKALKIKPNVFGQTFSQKFEIKRFLKKFVSKHFLEKFAVKFFKGLYNSRELEHVDEYKISKEAEESK